ncbi:MAG: hypothetical protein ACRDD1_01750, partial [Planctomycetia bacterium]
IRSASAVGRDRTATASAADYLVRLPNGVDADLVRTAVAAALAAASLPFTRRRPGKPDRVVDARPLLRTLTTTQAPGLPPEVHCRAVVTPEGSLRPDEILSLLQLEPALARSAEIVRTGVASADE